MHVEIVPMVGEVRAVWAEVMVLRSSLVKNPTRVAEGADLREAVGGAAAGSGGGVCNIV